MAQIKPFGTWPSAISPKALAGDLRLNDVQWDTASETLVWAERRGALGVLVAQTGVHAPRDLTSADYSVRGGVGYGGGEFTVSHGHVYFAGPGGRLYRQSLAEGEPQPITPAFGHIAAPRVSNDGQWIAFVHTYEHADGIGLVDSAGEMWPRKLAFGTDFVMQPAWHPDSTYLAYIAWNHPQMPWDGTELRLLTLDADAQGVPHVVESTTIAGDESTAIMQPEFSPDGQYLTYISDQTGTGQLYVYDLNEQRHTALIDDTSDYGKPTWVQGIRVYGWTHDSRAIYIFRNDQGFNSLWRYDTQAAQLERVAALDHYTSLRQTAVSSHRDAVAIIASSSTIPERIISYEPESSLPSITLTPPDVPSISVIVAESHGEMIHRRSSGETTPSGQLATAEALSWTGHDGETVYGLFYPPTHEGYDGIGLPPLIVNIHGGPTSQVLAGYSGDAQFFASRGFAYLDVNYRGSTGYGKTYMNKLRGSWGTYDVEDAASGAAYLVETGRVDGGKLIIKGGSAGGFTVLQSLIDKPGFYKAGVCLYGVSNQFLLAMETHKFEERYSDLLLGPLPEAADLYRERSPIFHADNIVDPVIVFQGADDVVVPQNQSDSIVASLKRRGITHEYHIYKGEGHGFRKPDTIEHYYTTLLKFLMQHVLYA